MEGVLILVNITSTACVHLVSNQQQQCCLFTNLTLGLSASPHS